MDLPENNPKQEKEKNFLVSTYIVFFSILILIIGAGIYFVSTQGFPNILENGHLEEVYQENKKSDILNQIRNLDTVNKEELQILSEAVSKDNSKVYLMKKYISLYEDDTYMKRHPYELVELNEPKVDVLSFNIADKNESKWLKLNFFKDKNSIYFLKEKKDLYNFDLKKPTEYQLLRLENVSVSTWTLYEDSDYSKDNSNIFYQEKIINEAKYNSFEYLGYGFARDNNNVYKYGYPSSTHNKTSFKPIYYGLYYIDDTIWSEQGFSYDKTLTKLDVENPKEFKKVGDYSKNRKLYDKYDIKIIATLFEDSNNYYSWEQISGTFSKYKKESSDNGFKFEENSFE